MTSSSATIAQHDHKVQKTRYVHYGCGTTAPETWTNFDASPTLRIERSFWLRWLKRGDPLFPDDVTYGDILRGLPIQSGSCKGIFCSHVLEHLAFEDFHLALRNTYSYLVPGGVFRLVMPDLRTQVKAYLADSNCYASIRFMETSHLGKRRRPRGVNSLIREWLGNSAHLWMWDEAAVAEKLAEHGFRNIRSARFGDADDPMFLDVETEGRFHDSFALECCR